nr:helix-turn-helix transcriptional regulator [Sphingomonas sp. BGYR3]
MHARGSNEAFLETLETRIRTEYPLLSARERQVLARTLTGEHADDTAAMLNMARGTVLTYRQRAYQKYGLGNASAFLSRLL